MSGWTSSRRGYKILPSYSNGFSTSNSPKITNPDGLSEVTLGNLDFSDGVTLPALMSKAGSGRMSPVRARTMKEYDQQIAELKKENFSLKLRIYFLEERMQQKFSGDGEELFKTNIELKVEVESLKKELLDKQELLKKASNALESISSQHQTELTEAKTKADNEANVKLTQQVTEVKKKMEEIQNTLETKEQEMQKYKKQFEDSQRRVQEFVEINQSLDNAYKQLEAKKRQLESDRYGRGHGQPDGGDADEVDGGASNGMAMLSEEIQDKTRIIDQLRNALKTKELILEQTEEEKKDIARDVKVPLESKIKQMERQLITKDREIQNLDERLKKTRESFNIEEKEKIKDFKKSIDEMEIVGEQLTKEITAKDDMIGKLEDIIREKDGLKRELDRKAKELEKSNKTHEENALKRDKAIQGLTMALLEKDKELGEANSIYEEKIEELNQAKDAVHQLNMQKFQGLEEHQHALSKREEKIAELESSLREKQLENERLKKNIDRKHNEISRLSAQLEKSDEVLRQREDNMQGLLSDLQRQVDGKEKSLQQLGKTLQDRDSQIQHYGAIVNAQQPAAENREGLINSLKQQLTDKDHDLQEIISEKYKAVEDKDNESRQLKMALRERDHDIDRANQMLVATEQTIDTLEKESKEKDTVLQQLSDALRAQQATNKEVGEKQSKTIKEKDDEIDNLKDTLIKTESRLQIQTPGYMEESLRAEKDIYLSLNKADQLAPREQVAAIEVELAAVEALRNQLQNTVDKNEQLKALLEGATSAIGENYSRNVSELENRVKNLESELQESRRHNSALQTQLAGQRPPTTGSSATHHKQPFGQLTPLRQGGAAASPSAAHGDSITFSTSYLPSFLGLPSVEDIVPDDAELSTMSPNQLCSVIHDLKSELQKSHSVSTEMQHQLSSLPEHVLRGEIPGQNKHDRHNVATMTTAELNESEQLTAGNTSHNVQIENLKEELNRVETDRHELDRRLSTILYGPTSDKDVRIIPVLKEELQELRRKLDLANSNSRSSQDGRNSTDNIINVFNNSSKSQHQMEVLSRLQDEVSTLRQQLCHTESVNGLLKRQIELNSTTNDGAFNPELICQMAAEIERLKQEMDNIDNKSSHKPSESSSVDEISPRLSANGKSGIPVLKKHPLGTSVVPVSSNRVLQRQVEEMRAELSDYKMSEQSLQSKLSSSEATVKSQAESLRLYRGQLQNNSISIRTPSPTRSNNDFRTTSPSPHYRSAEHSTVLASAPYERGTPTGGEMTIADPSPLSTGLDLTQFDSFGQTANVTELKSQISELKMHLTQSQGSVNELKVKLSKVANQGPKEVTGQRLNGFQHVDKACQFVDPELEERRLAGVTPTPSTTAFSAAFLTPLAITPFAETKAANDLAFNRLNREVSLLREKLKSSEELNQTLQWQLDESVNCGASNTSVGNFPTKEQLEGVLMALRNENDVIRHQLNDSQSLCQTLRLRLEDLSAYLQDLFLENEDGQINQLTLQQVVELREKIQETQKMTSNLQVSLRLPNDDSNSNARNFEVRQLGVAQDPFENGTMEMDLSFLNESGREPFQTLELQLTGRGKNSNLSEKEIEKLQKENKDLKNKINQLNKQLDERDIVARSLEQEKALSKEKNSYLQQEINRLRQEWLHLKDGLSSEHQNTSRYVDQIDSLQTELGKSRKQANDLKEILIEEQEKFRLSDREKEDFVQEMERLSDDNGRLSAEKVAMQERNISLQEELSRLKEECNQMMVDRSHQLALYEELKADRDRYKDGYMGREDVNSQLKQLVQDNQKAADKLKDEIHRLTGEVEDKNSHIGKLRHKLSRVQQKYGVPSAELASQPGDLDDLPVDEAVPQRKGSTVESVSALYNGGPGSQRTEFHTVVGNNDNKNGTSTGSRSPQRLISSGSVTPQRKHSMERGSPTTGIFSQDGGTCGSVSPLQSHYSNNNLDEIEHRSQREEAYQREIYLLQGQLKAMRELNDHLKKENNLYMSLNTNSVGVQNSPKVGSFSTQAGGSSFGEFDLREHLEEIRLLRKRLEDSINQNNKLRELLERQLSEMGIDGETVKRYMCGVQENNITAAAVKDNLDEMTRELQLIQHEVEAKNREISHLTRELQDHRREQVKKDKIFMELEQRLKTKDETLQMITLDAETKGSQLKSTRHDIKRLKDEVNVLRASAEEQHELNKTLKLELSVLDKMNESQDAGTMQTSEGLDLNLLMQELRQLRIQLEKSIENNNLLRQKLDEHLSRGFGSNKSSPLSTLNFQQEINRNNFYGGDTNKKYSDRYGSEQLNGSFHDDANSIGSLHKGKSNGSLHGSQNDLAVTIDDLYINRLENGHIPSERDSILKSGAGRSPAGSLRSPASSRHTPSGSRSHTPVNGVSASPPTKLERSGSLDRHSPSKVSRPSSRGSRNDDFPLYSHDLDPEQPRDHHYDATENPLVGSMYSMNGGDSSLPHKTSPQMNGFMSGSSDGAMRYSVLDPHRPPGSTTLRVGSDLRQLYAIGELDDYELLKKEITESHCILNGMEAKVRDRLRKYKHSSQTESQEYQILRGIISSIHQAKTLNGEANRLVSLFWMSQLPLRDESGNFVDIRMLKQNQSLQDELVKYKRECTHLKGQLSDANIRMQVSSKSRDGMELELFKQLNNHHMTLRKANTNLEQAALDRHLSAYR